MLATNINEVKSKIIFNSLSYIFSFGILICKSNLGGIVIA